MRAPIASADLSRVEGAAAAKRPAESLSAGAVPADNAVAPPPGPRSPFTPPEAAPPSRPIAKPEEGARRHEGLAAFGSGVIVLLVAALVAWLLYLALG
ncbi:hypothetical protein [Falsiroseomonas tokyonensis]|uniref:Translation initiation factor 2 n=1 Tax=Falsiroseomonas tokyonensis TaxID=430521 RepID=A0ABV7C4H3_9PROT|nr:hypothetical protein [Falsiroseomonas tokyonensis]MBU8541526.1 hypothetical protein [Falsiroseomonas tokyonensis]